MKVLSEDIGWKFITDSVSQSTKLLVYDNEIWSLTWTLTVFDFKNI